MRGVSDAHRVLMGLTRLELVTPSLSEKCSNRLSYRPQKKELRKQAEMVFADNVERSGDLVKTNNVGRLPAGVLAPLSSKLYQAVVTHAY